ncbi:YjbQ family protein [Dehalococcoidia bacterium]|nr:YjbQ family protein [Dehalococcoidia bacterium]
MGQSLVVPLVQNKAILGTWQRIVIVDFDSRPRSREVILQIMGE